MSSYGLIENNTVRKIEKMEDFEKLNRHEEKAMKVFLSLKDSVSNTL